MFTIDPLPAAFMPGKMLRQQDRRLHVHRKGAPDVLVGLVLGLDPGGDVRRVVHQDVDGAPERLEAGAGHLFDLVALGEVGRDRRQTPCHRRLVVELGATARDGHDPCSCHHQRPGKPGPDSRARTGDDGGLPFEVEDVGDGGHRGMFTSARVDCPMPRVAGSAGAPMGRHTRGSCGRYGAAAAR